MADEPPGSPRAPWNAAELVAALALRQADRDLARAERQLGRVLEGLPPSPRDEDPEDLETDVEPDTPTSLRVAARCALENLAPARGALREIQPTFDRFPPTLDLDAGSLPPRSPHVAFRDLLADLQPSRLAGLRHLLTCPLCQALARQLLLDLPRDTAPERPAKA